MGKPKQARNQHDPLTAFDSCLIIKFPAGVAALALLHLESTHPSFFSYVALSSTVLSITHTQNRTHLSLSLSLSLAVMGTISNPATSYSLMDTWFDLDEALTLPEEHIGGACGGGI
ncbi:hypothetical protein GBA52_022708 [Prunus armeniaca]|nr:hypothetical protein GBA52_022708 [Prunus armeniaca]